MAADGRSFQAVVRTGTPGEAGYYRHGGIMQYALRSLRYAGRLRRYRRGSRCRRPGWAVASPQKKSAYGAGRRCGGGGGLVQCDSIHRTRGSGPGGDTGSTNTRT